MFTYTYPMPYIYVEYRLHLYMSDEKTLIVLSYDLIYYRLTFKNNSIREKIRNNATERL